MKELLPLMLDLNGKGIIIFGGGDVGERKASLFCDHARVTVMSRDFTPSLKKLSEEGKIELIQVSDLTDKEISRHIKNAFIVIPATSDAGLNEKISSSAGRHGKLVNRVDGIGDIIVPSIIRRGDIVIGISTFGQSPALSKYIRERIESVITPELAMMSRLQNEIRETLKSVLGDQKKRKEILWNIINDNEIWTAFHDSYEKAYKVALKHIDRIEQSKEKKLE